jgi:hypothetical protein
MEPIPKQQMPFDVLVAVICSLMSHYAQSPDPAVAETVRRHLEQLVAHPACPSTLCDAGNRLALFWRRLAARPNGLPKEQNDGAAKVH